MNCWEYMECGRELGGSRAEELGVCPAYPDNGSNCARIAGTLCGGQVQGTAAMKLGACIKCQYFLSEHFNKCKS